MKALFYRLLFLFIPFFTIDIAEAQFYKDTLTATDILAKRGEVYFRFLYTREQSLSELSSIISIDNVFGDTVYAYANQKEFDRFLTYGIPYFLLTAPSLRENLLHVSRLKSSSGWDYYPTYLEYLTMMDSFARIYPERCLIDTIGYSVEGKLLLAAKISDNVTENETEPRVFFSSSMHGDEPLGYVLMLRLIDSLLIGYDNSQEINRMINEMEIFINPLANPDGLFFSSDTTITGATRGNANNVDLNRNFPDPRAGTHPDGSPWQPETESMMQYMQRKRFHLSANFHGGAEVVNYPWDTWSRRHPDDSWFREISCRYADTVHAFSPAHYFRYPSASGITNGYDWYTVTGGRQDYVTYFLQGREVTIELGIDKIPAPNELPAYWEYNKRSMLNYLKESLTGFHGRVLDASTSDPKQTNITIIEHDQDNSWIQSDSSDGVFRRMLKSGTYHFRISTDDDTLLLEDFPVGENDVFLYDFFLPSQGIYGSVINPGDSVTSDDLSFHFNSSEFDSVFILPGGSQYFAFILPAGFFDLSVIGKTNDTLYADTFKIRDNVISFREINLEKKSGDIVNVKKSGRFKIYPNPFDDFFLAELDENIGFPAWVTIYSITGKVVHRYKINGFFSGKSLKINAGELTPGVYLLKIKTMNQMYETVVLKSR